MGPLNIVIFLFMLETVFLLTLYCFYLGLPCSSDGKESACNAGEKGSIPGSERSSGERNSNPLLVLAWRIPWTNEPGGLQLGRKEPDTTGQLTQTKAFIYLLRPLKTQVSPVSGGPRERKKEKKF